MNIVVTMAGLGLRFQKAGYIVPKYMITVNNKTLFEWSMLSLYSFWKRPDTRFIFIVRKEDKAEHFITEQCKFIGIMNYKIVEIDRLTSGQAETVTLASSYWNASEGLLIYNIDTYIEPDQIQPQQLHGDGFIPCFKAQGDHWSFVKLDSSGKAIEVREKSRISDNCSIGLYYFKSCQLYISIYDQYYRGKDHLESGERYVAPLYNELIRNNNNVYISVLPENKVHVLGTPEELDIFKKSFSIN